jgi:hypothetical protein
MRDSLNTSFTLGLTLLLPENGTNILRIITFIGGMQVCNLSIVLIQILLVQNKQHKNKYFFETNLVFVNDVDLPGGSQIFATLYESASRAWGLV